jgi:hypothetical protein
MLVHLEPQGIDEITQGFNVTNPASEIIVCQIEIARL